MVARNKSFNEDFAQFFDNPSREGLRTILEHHGQETDNIDFKEEWPTGSKLARHIIAIAKSGGKCIVVRVGEGANGAVDPIGMKSLVDISVVHKSVQKFLANTLEGSIPIINFTYESSDYAKLAGKCFQVMFIGNLPQYIPFLPESDGDGINRATIYVRRCTSSQPASHDEVQEIINRRIETGYSSSAEDSLRAELAKLKELYDSIKPNRFVPSPIQEFFQHGAGSLFGTLEENPDYPAESFDAYISRLIESKKRQINRFLGVDPTVD